MCHTLNPAPMIGLDRNNESVVANRHELILNRLRRPAHQPFERTRDSRAQRVDLMTNSGQLRTGPIVELSVRQNLVSDTRDEGVEFAWEILDQLPKHWGLLPLSKNSRPR